MRQSWVKKKAESALEKVKPPDLTWVGSERVQLLYIVDMESVAPKLELEGC